NTYGNKPYSIAVIHGGPGAAGEMLPVAKTLAVHWGVLEPLQTATSIDGQLEELKSVLETNGDAPIQFIGFSWGAWLSYLCAAKFPGLVSKLILVGSGSFDEKYAPKIQQTRSNRLNKEDRKKYDSLLKLLNDQTAENKNETLQQLGALCVRADTFEPIDSETPTIDFRADIFQSVWQEAAALRRSGKLLEWGKKIQCPVVAIHGDYDPHPAEGVREPLAAVLNNFRFILLKNCGHKPWIERWAKDDFYRILEDELGNRRGNWVIG
ncbi:alpha/beta hydrolase, partial [candidate division KSB1 bacterium]|nr:alpha/beta hydrolase [candidate division KSB1 bacterium]